MWIVTFHRLYNLVQLVCNVLISYSECCTACLRSNVHSAAKHVMQLMEMETDCMCYSPWAMSQTAY